MDAGILLLCPFMDNLDNEGIKYVFHRLILDHLKGMEMFMWIMLKCLFQSTFLSAEGLSICIMPISIHLFSFLIYFMNQFWHYSFHCNIKMKKFLFQWSFHRLLLYMNIDNNFQSCNNLGGMAAGGGFGIVSFGPRSSIGGRCLWWSVTDW